MSHLFINNQEIKNDEGNPITVDGTVNVGNFPATQTNPTDAFGRLRISQPLTLFDSSHRFADNDLWAEDITGTASSTFNQDAGLIELDVGASDGDEIIRETNKVF